MTLIPISNLDSLNDTQKQEYLVQVCEYFGIPPNLNLLEYMKMESGDGNKVTVLYAKKGATDMLRETRGISIIDLQQNITEKAAIFTAKAQDKNGRTEIAVGAADIEGYIGRELANRIMVAQTRATRRVTLQFIGGGFLDESEVTSQTTNINSMSSIPMPISAPIAGIASQAVQPTVNATAPKENRTKEQNDAQEALDRMTTKSRLRRHTTTFSLQEPEDTNKVEKAQFKPQFIDPQKAADAPAPTTAELIEKGVLTQADTKPVFTVSPEVKEAFPTVPDYVLSGEMAYDAGKKFDKEVLAPALQEGLPTDEEAKRYKTRLKVYTEEVFPQAGMVPSEGLGGVTMKVRIYVMMRYKKTDLKKLLVADWEDLLAYFDKTDAKTVVAAIEEAITK